MLDKAKDVNEALGLFRETGYVVPCIILISDSSNKTATIEMDDDRHSIQLSEDEIFRANHYKDREMLKEQEVINPTSQWRERAFAEHKESLDSIEEIERFLTTDFPDGLYEPYYGNSLDTMWSVIFDPKHLEVDLALGAGAKHKLLKISLMNELKERSMPLYIDVDLSSIALEDRLEQYGVSGAGKSEYMPVQARGEQSTRNQVP